MFGWFKRKSQASNTGENIISFPPGEIFPWPKRMVLTAVDELMLCLPKALLDPNRPFGEFVFGSPGMQVNIPPDGENFLVWLQPGMTISLVESAESYVHAEDNRPRRVKITAPPSPPAAQTTSEQIIREYAKLPNALSIEPVATSLARHTVFVPIDETTTKQGRIVGPETLRIKTSNDIEGRTWAYGYTNREQFSLAFPGGGGFAELSFERFFEIIERDGKFGGIALNAGSEADYYIPRELFETVKQAFPGCDGHGD